MKNQYNCNHLIELIGRSGLFNDLRSNRVKGQITNDEDLGRLTEEVAQIFPSQVLHQRARHYVSQDMKQLQKLALRYLAKSSV